jgi:radical SAM superfamily enzyme YgiQ (UPF0313 family)
MIPPMGVMYLASYLRSKSDVEVRIVDLKFLPDFPRQLRDILGSFRPHVVGISALSVEMKAAREAARLVKRFDQTLAVILGGPHATAYTEDALGEAGGDADVAVIGEGEETFAEIVELVRAEGPRWCSPDNLRAVAGIAYRDEEGRVVRSPSRAHIEDLDALPFPAWDLVDVERYWKITSMATVGIRPYMPIFTSRGCPYRCIYCHNMFGKRFRARSAENVVQEVQELRHRYGVNDLEVIDDISNFDQARLNSILEGLLARSLQPRLNFPNGIRSDRIGEDTIDLLQNFGPGEITIPIESATPRLQRLMKKNLNLQKARRTVELFANRRFLTRGVIMLGFPTETEQEMRASIDFLCDAPFHIGVFFATIPYQRTELYEMCRELGKLPASSNTFEYEFWGVPFNGSEVPDRRFRWLHWSAYLRFYSDPVRLYRLVRERPYWRDVVWRTRDLILRTPIRARSFLW